MDTIRFDLGSVRFAPEPLPLVEAWSSMITISRGRRSRQPDRCSLIAQQLPASVRPLLDWVASFGNRWAFATSLDPDLERALEAVRSAPTPIIRTHLADGAETKPAAAPRGTGSRKWLCESLEAYFHACLRPVWPEIVLSHERELIRFGRSAATQGIRRTLQALLPAISWGEEKAGGTRVVLIPSPFWTGEARAMPLSQGELALVYESSATRPWEVAAIRHQTLEHLIGPTRAAVLASLVKPCGTTELARRVNMSAATASEHATVLRNSALIVTVREGRSVVHHLTELGGQLVDPGLR